MAENRQSEDQKTRTKGPFPERRPGAEPWNASERGRGPYERRSGVDRRGPSAEPTPADGERRRPQGRRKADVLSSKGRKSLGQRSRSLAQKLREPVIGLTLAGLAVPLVTGTRTPGATDQPGAELEEGSEADVADRDLEEEVGDYWADAEEAVVRDHTIQGAVTRYDIDQALAQKIYDSATLHGIEPDVAFGLVFTESTFRERAVSHVGARGLTQLMPGTAQWLDPEISTRDLYDPDVNLELGFRYLRHLIDKYEGDIETALTAYNRGPGTVDRILDRGGDPDNGYAGKVMAG